MAALSSTAGSPSPPSPSANSSLSEHGDGGLPADSTRSYEQLLAFESACARRRFDLLSSIKTEDKMEVVQEKAGEDDLALWRALSRARAQLLAVPPLHAVPASAPGAALVLAWRGSHLEVSVSAVARGFLTGQEGDLQLRLLHTLPSGRILDDGHTSTVFPLARENPVLQISSRELVLTAEKDDVGGFLCLQLERLVACGKLAPASATEESALLLPFPVGLPVMCGRDEERERKKRLRPPELERVVGAPAAKRFRPSESDSAGNLIDITELLGLPQKEAAQRLGISESMLCKRFKECTKRKWPYRAICKLEKSMRLITANTSKPTRFRCPATQREEAAKMARLQKLRDELLAPVKIRITHVPADMNISRVIRRLPPQEVVEEAEEADDAEEDDDDAEPEDDNGGEADLSFDDGDERKDAQPLEEAVTILSLLHTAPVKFS